jgi:hypothetical protein
MVQGTERLRIAAIRSSDLQPTEGSALRPLRARARHPERAANQRKYWSESRSPSQSSNSADRFPNGKVLSSPLRPCQGKGPVVFPLVSVLLVGATGFEPVTASVSDPTDATGPVRRTVKGSWRMVRKPQVNAGASARTLRQSVTILQRSCSSLRRSVAAHMLPRCHLTCAVGPSARSVICGTVRLGVSEPLARSALADAIRGEVDQISEAD